MFEMGGLDAESISSQGCEEKARTEVVSSVCVSD